MSVSIDDLVYFRDKVLDEEWYDYLGWELSSGKVILIHPFVAVFDSTNVVPIFPGATFRTQAVWRNGVKDYTPSQFKKPSESNPWWKFW